ncbi:MAG: hypothetical protein COB81_09570 [Flavobacteriaceae bacterium]|nr:MAG: hypothetical protein COB81_09570 [Flavobacteriaceae bacterium]
MNNFPFTVADAIRSFVSRFRFSCKSIPQFFTVFLLVITLLAGFSGNAQITVTRTSFDYFIVDSNTPIDGGPRANYMSFEIFNNTMVDTNILTAKINVSGVDSNLRR